MNMKETEELARKTPKIVIDTLEKLLVKYPIGCMICMAHECDAVVLGEFMIDIFNENESVSEYFVDETGGMIDGDKMDLAIIALTLKMSGKL